MVLTGIKQFGEGTTIHTSYTMYNEVFPSKTAGNC